MPYAPGGSNSNEEEEEEEEEEDDDDDSKPPVLPSSLIFNSITPDSLFYLIYNASPHFLPQLFIFFISLIRISTATLL
jgi:hypothetical protein